MKLKAIQFLFVSVALLFVFVSSGEAEILQKMSGVTTQIDLSSQKLHVRFEHPVTGENSDLTFDIVASTCFKNAKSLKDIQPNDLVSIDYEKNGQDQLEAVYVEIVSLTKLPFSPERVKKSFFSLRNS